MWMLFLSAALVAVDYFLGEVHLHENWQLLKLPSGSDGTPADYPARSTSGPVCSLENGYDIFYKKGRLYGKAAKSDLQLLVDSMISDWFCTERQLFFLSDRRFQDNLYVFSKQGLIKIAGHLHGPARLSGTHPEGCISMAEKARDRVLKFCPKNI